MRGPCDLGPLAGPGLNSSFPLHWLIGSVIPLQKHWLSGCSSILFCPSFHLQVLPAMQTRGMSSRPRHFFRVKPCSIQSLLPHASVTPNPFSEIPSTEYCEDRTHPLLDHDWGWTCHAGAHLSHPLPGSRLGLACRALWLLVRGQPQELGTGSGGGRWVGEWCW